MRSRDLHLTIACLGVALTVGGFFVACIPPGCQTPECKQAYVVAQIDKVTVAFLHAAVEANATLDPQTGKPLLSTETTRRIVVFCASVEATLKAVPAGWQTTVLAAYAGLKDQLSADERAKLATWIIALDTAMAVLLGP